MTDRSTELRFDVPHSARVWNYWLGGKDNYPPDRAVGDAVAAQNPEILVIARQARQFRQCFEGLEMVEPGLVPTPLWRPAPTDIGTPEPIDSYCAVGRKP